LTKSVGSFVFALCLAALLANVHSLKLSASGTIHQDDMDSDDDY